MNTKWIRHPNLPAGQEVEVPAQSLSHYAHSGWEVLDEPPAWAAVRPEDAALAELENGPVRRTDDELQEIARKASGMPKSPSADSEDEKPTGKRSRRVPSKEDQ